MTEIPVASAVEELALAKETLEAARVLAAAGLHRHSVGRAYYAIFHAACALLASDRNVADYDASATFVDEDSRADIARADGFLSAVEAILGGARTSG